MSEGTHAWGRARFGLYFRKILVAGWKGVSPLVWRHRSHPRSLELPESRLTLLRPQVCLILQGRPVSSPCKALSDSRVRQRRLPTLERKDGLDPSVGRNKNWKPQLSQCMGPRASTVTQLKPAQGWPPEQLSSASSEERTLSLKGHLHPEPRWSVLGASGGVCEARLLGQTLIGWRGVWSPERRGYSHYQKCSLETG